MTQGTVLFILFLLIVIGGVVLLVRRPLKKHPTGADARGNIFIKESKKLYFSSVFMLVLSSFVLLMLVLLAIVDPQSASSDTPLLIGFFGVPFLLGLFGVVLWTKNEIRFYDGRVSQRRLLGKDGDMPLSSVTFIRIMEFPLSRKRLIQLFDCPLIEDTEGNPPISTGKKARMRIIRPAVSLSVKQKDFNLVMERLKREIPEVPFIYSN